MNVPASLLLGALMALPASGQLAPPPPPPVEKPPVMYPPPPPPPREPEPQGRRGMPAPPNFEFKKLAEFDEAGNLKPLHISPEYLSVVRNPKLRADQAPAIREALAEHYRRVDDLVIENIDLVMDVAGGVFDDANLNNPEDFNMINAIMGALMTARGLPEYLRDQQAIDVPQMNATKAIFSDWVQTYNKTALDKAIAKHGKENQRPILEDAGRSTFHLLSMEAMIAFRRMALQVAEHFDAVVEAADLRTETADAAKEARRAIREAADDDARYQAVVEFLQELRFGEQQAVLEANRKIAPPRAFPELDDLGDAEG